MPVVDLSFPLVGSQVPRDHGYPLYGALSRALPSLHGAEWLGVHPLPGKPVGDGQLLLGERAALRLRLPAERIPEVLPLAGRVLDVGGASLRVGVPRVHPLAPAPALDARIVLIRLTAPGDGGAAPLPDADTLARRYEEEIARQLSRLDIAAPFSLRGRQRITVAGRRLVGFSVRVEGLDAAASLRLQEHGLGGKRAMGCGIFRPTRG